MVEGQTIKKAPGYLSLKKNSSVISYPLSIPPRFGEENQAKKKVVLLRSDSALLSLRHILLWPEGWMACCAIIFIFAIRNSAMLFRRCRYLFLDNIIIVPALLII